MMTPATTPACARLPVCKPAQSGSWARGDVEGVCEEPLVEGSVSVGVCVGAGIAFGVGAGVDVAGGVCAGAGGDASRGGDVGVGASLAAGVTGAAVDSGDARAPQAAAGSARTDTRSASTAGMEIVLINLQSHAPTAGAMPRIVFILPGISSEFVRKCFAKHSRNNCHYKVTPAKEDLGAVSAIGYSIRSLKRLFPLEGKETT